MTEQQRQQLEALQKQLGDRGEDFALRYERQRLHAHPRHQDVHLIGRHDVGMGYDIISFMGPTSTTHDRYIEVKTYSDTPHFFLSAGEQAAAQKYGDSYFLYLVDINKVTTLGYKPLIIQDPLTNLSEQWQEKVQSREFLYVDPTATNLPKDLDTSTVLVGCFNSNEHLNWILSRKCYNVRQGLINGSVATNEMTAAPAYLLLYSVRDPRTYRIYDISRVTTATHEQMLTMRYPNPHARCYLLYHLRSRLDTIPLDIKQLLSAHNDKLSRTSGTPIYISGATLRRYIIGAPTQQGTAPKRIFSNEGRPWTAATTSKLIALYQSGTTIPALAHDLKRPVEEIKAQLHLQGLT